ncbi:MAG: vitamin B12-dependent ribonucleotide reductase [Planctomycetota bacterium]
MTGAPESRHPFDEIEWATRRAEIRAESGEIVFAQDVEAPAGWSASAVNVVASRYFHGALDSADREDSVKQLFRRVGGTLAQWVRAAGLAGDEYEPALLELLVRQRGAFNSPVWFNVGLDEAPQCSACYILRVEDQIESILDLARIEALIFKRGSGAGSNLSALRSSFEALSTGGRASGPVSFMKGYDAFAGVIKSGGRNRRAAKMQLLDADHPDVFDFVSAKRVEEQKARTLIDAGYSAGLDGDAYASVAYQNSNISVRVPDEFLRAVETDSEWSTVLVTSGAVAEKFPARKLLRTIAEGAWECGDPGLQYSSTIERWNPCRASGRIRASNPCSEYLFLDDTACNLASLNLLAFLDDSGRFDVDRFKSDIGLLFRAMESIVDKSSYPTPSLEQNSRRFRPLGLGYANLGALLMALGLPYNSKEARGWAGAITALLTGEAYRVSGEIAADVGAFEAFQENREPFLSVLENHRAALDLVSDAPAEIHAAARAAWSSAIGLAQQHGVRNAQATVLAPTGTIAFLMDCDTTGIEPDLSLVKYKRLTGGGSLKLVNSVVGRALATLGYDASAREKIVTHLRAENTIEGAPGLSNEHLPVFDCAFRPTGGVRSISPAGHLTMMAAVQPFLSGGISKTVNLPESVTVEEVEQIFLRAWKLDLKAIALYRENSKSAQPLTTEPVVACRVDVSAPTCTICGTGMVPSGSCFRCLECGEVSSCS